MSGGVDSSVAAWMLKTQGRDITGFTMAHTDTPMDREAVESAGAVCAALGIPHHVVDIRRTFRKTVIDYFCGAYFEGRTPNPCVACNRRIKFGLLFDRMHEHGMHAMATGHYARIGKDPHTGRPTLNRAADPGKDQSYFLYRLNRGMLARTLFPLGEHTKEQVRAMARDAALPVSVKSESQEICFVPCDYGPFVAAHSPEKVGQGQIVDTDGNLLGWHEGIHLYTIGQRRGLGVSSAEPLYVLRIEPGENRVVVAPDDLLYSDSFMVRDISMFSGEPREKPLHADVKIRYNTPAAPALVQPADCDGALRVVPDTPLRAITPGQSAVFYNGDTVLGGGIIE